MPVTEVERETHPLAPFQKMCWHTAMVDVSLTYHDLMQNDAAGIFITSTGFHGARAAFSYAVTNLTLKGCHWGKKEDTFLGSSREGSHFPFHRYFDSAFDQHFSHSSSFIFPVSLLNL